ncbi:MAG: radical SAM protein [Anaerolineae bacterium]
MDSSEKIALLGKAAQYDICRGCGQEDSRIRDDLGRWIYPAVRPDGKRINLLKVLQSNICERDCAYCANRSQRDIRRTTFSPDELARTFDLMVQRRLVQGLFLSSGVCGSTAHATGRMLATVELIRRRYLFRGYIHLKILPGADDASIEASLRLAQRVSVNLEAPNRDRIGAISHTKSFESELLRPLQRAHHLRVEEGQPVSLTTQFVVGAADESDRELLSTASQLYSHIHLERAYYSAFQPIAQTPLEDHPATPAWREHRLYQADFLLRQYGFFPQEFVFAEQGDLPREADPKLLWALHHPEQFPIEVNTAPEPTLLRVPGIGPTSVKRLVTWRRQGRITELRQIRQAGALAERAAPFLLLNGVRPPFQQSLWPEALPRPS